MGTAALLFFALPALADENSAMQPKQMVNINASGQAALSGTLKSIGTNSLVLSSWGGDWTITWTASTSLLRKFEGHGSLTELMVGDNMQVKGKVNTNSPWTIDARMVQDNSIQTRSASFSGTISNLNGNTFTLTTKKRGALQVMVNADAKIRVGDATGSLADLANGMMVSASGVWNTSHSTLLASKVVVSQTEKEKEMKHQENNQ